MMKLKYFVFLITLSFLAGCEFQVDIADKSAIEGAGVKFQIPMETSTANTSKLELSYESKRFKARTDGKNLWIDGISYGLLNKGDVIDFYDYPTIKVNGEIRSPSGV